MTGHRTPIVLAAIGGASGVGKTSVLNAALPTLEAKALVMNTGTYFKNALQIESRDDVRVSDWPDVEARVARAIADDIRGSDSSLLIVDTHFAAKTRFGTYRVGLDETLITAVAQAAADTAEIRGVALLLRVALIYSEVAQLLDRRRHDTTRARELDAYDCYNALRHNRRCGPHYSSAFRRVDNAHTRFVLLENKVLADAARGLASTLTPSEVRTDDTTPT